VIKYSPQFLKLVFGFGEYTSKIRFIEQKANVLGHFHRQKNNQDIRFNSPFFFIIWLKYFKSQKIKNCEDIGFNRNPEN
jgi:hypothetical protein